MTAIHSTPLSTLHRGDSLAVLSTLPSASVDAVVTDPPYCSSGSSATASANRSARDKYVSGDAAHTLPDFPGENRDQRSYLAWMTMLLGECLRISQPGAPLIVFCDWRQLPTMTDAIQAAGWAWRGIVPWHKPIARPTKGGFTNRCEYALWGSNGALQPGDEPVYLDGWVSGSQPRGSNRVHITQKPTEVMQHLLGIVPADGLVLDPFTGSGTTGVAAVTTGRRFLGIELTEHYARVAAERLANAEAGLLREPGAVTSEPEPQRALPRTRCR